MGEPDRAMAAGDAPARALRTGRGRDRGERHAGRDGRDGAPGRCEGRGSRQRLRLLAAAAVAPAPHQRAADLDAPARLRSGLVVGLTLGGGIGSASGYPNAASDINNPTFYSASGFMGGSSGTFFVMGALSDYLSFGFWLGSAMYRNADWRSNGGGGACASRPFRWCTWSPPWRAWASSETSASGAQSAVDQPRAARVERDAVVSGRGVFYEWPFGTCSRPLRGRAEPGIRRRRGPAVRAPRPDRQRSNRLLRRSVAAVISSRS